MQLSTTTFFHHGLAQCHLAGGRVSIKEKHELIKEGIRVKKRSLKEIIKNGWIFLIKSKIRKSELRKEFKVGEQYLFDEKPVNEIDFELKNELDRDNLY